MESVSESELEKKLRTFENTKDPDIEGFLQRDAIPFEKRRWSATYLVVSNDETFSGACIEGYFTLSFQAYHVPESISKRRIKKLFGGILPDTAYCTTVLIGQLGKHIGEDYISAIHGSELLDIAFTVISELNQLVYCPNVLLECSVDRPNLQEMYSEYGFKEYQRNEQFIEMIAFL